MAKKKPSRALLPTERIERSILLVRGQKVLLDADLAEMYDVETRVLVQAVKRNLDRFPDDFMFQLSKEELEDWRSQFVTSNPTVDHGNLKSQIVTSSWGGRRTRPYAFTEQGVAMLSSVLHSPRAVAVNIEIMRAFVRLREMLSSNVELSRRLDTLERKYDAQFRGVFEAIRQLMAPPVTPKKGRIGFHVRGGED